MSTDTIINGRVSFWQRVCLLGLIALSVVMGTIRLNDCDLFNPDSPRYVIYSKAIVDLGEYRATDLPGSPLYSWRPPGLPLLLAPVMAIWPYDVVAAKAVILVTGALLLWTVFHLSALHCGGWVALVATAVVASSPSFYVLSTEVLTEIPYTLGVLVVLLVLSRSTISEPATGTVANHWPQRLSMVVAIAALAFTPWLRTAGIALVAAVGIWSFHSRARFQWLAGFTVAVAAFGVLAWRNKVAGGENYIGTMLARIREQGAGPVLASGMETIWHYASAAPGLLLPGITCERPWYSPLTMDGSPTLGLPYLFAACGASVLVSLGLIGMCNRRAHGGSLALLYVLIYCACLVIWPWRHERFLWPLVPVLVSYVPTGVSGIAACLPVIQGGIAFIGTISLVALFGWQSLACQQIADVNRDFLKDRDAFHATRFPGFYFSNWRRAGTWLNAHSPPSARVLTWHTAVAGTSHRFQKRVQFETLTPEKLRQQIEAFSARYLVVPDAQFGDGFSWQQLDADPAIRLNVVYREQDVVVLEVTPNRTGEVFNEAYPKWLAEHLSLVETARKQYPQRADLAIRHATLLRESGQVEDAKRILRELLDEGVKTVRVCSELGWLLFDNEEYLEAAKYLDMARTLPNAETIASQLVEGISQAKERAASQIQPSVERQLNRVKSLMSLLKYAAAERELDRIMATVPANAQVLFLHGRLSHRLGERAAAEACYENAMKLGSTDAQPWLLELRCSDAIEKLNATMVTAGGQHELIDPSIPATYVQVAKSEADKGWTGRALATLEKASKRFPNDPAIQISLADLYRKFSMPELALPLYEAVLKSNPTDDVARKGLQTAQFGLLEPVMARQKKRLNEGLYVRGNQSILH